VILRMNELSKRDKPAQLDESGMGPLLTEGWKLTGEWVGAWLDLHPNASAKQLQAIFPDFTPPPYKGIYDEKRANLYAMGGSATRVAKDVYVVASTYGPEDIEGTSGTFFVVSRDASGHFRPIWDIKPLAERHYELRDEIGLWAVLESCAYHCGPMAVNKVLPLPPTAKGLPRFAVDAYQASNGGTVEAQLGVWEWDGKEAHAELIQSYNYAADYGGIHSQGNLVRIVTKEPTSTLVPCGMCPEPRGDWTLRLTPNGIEDLGHRFRTPEIEWADQLLTTVAKSGDASALASPEALSALRDAIAKQRAKYPPTQGETEEEKAFVFFGLYEKCRILSRRTQGQFVIEEDDATFRFYYEKRGGKPFFTRVSIQPGRLN